MTDTSTGSPQTRPGNDGTWFLEAIGATPDEANGESAETTGPETDTDLWTRSPDALAGWSPEDVSPAVDSRRNVSATVIVLAVVVAIGVTVLAFWVPGTSARRADGLASDYRNALGEVRTDLPETQQVLAEVTEPSADVSQFPQLIPTLSDLRTDAETTLDLASAPLPSPWPLAPSAPFEDLEPTRNAMIVEATSADAIGRRIGDVLDYRMSANDILDTGDLPTGDDDVDLDELNSLLAQTATDTAAVIGELPEDAALFDHKAAAESALERFLDWQASYVDALRTGSADLVAAHLDELSQAKAELDSQLVSALARVRADIDAEIIELAAALDETILEIPSG